MCCLRSPSLRLADGVGSLLRLKRRRAALFLQADKRQLAEGVAILAVLCA